jgi:hypothetical protein
MGPVVRGSHPGLHRPGAAHTYGRRRTLRRGHRPLGPRLCRTGARAGWLHVRSRAPSVQVGDLARSSASRSHRVPSYDASRLADGANQLPRQPTCSSQVAKTFVP